MSEELERSGMDEEAEIARRFTYHPPKPELNQARRYEIIREHGKDFGLHLVDECPPSRERSLALTKLEEVVMWANAAIARNE